MVAVLAGCGSTARSGAVSTGGPDGCTRGTIPADLACIRFVSQSGTEGTSSVAWLASDPLTVTFDDHDGTPTLVVMTPCNPVNVPVELDGRRLTSRAQEMIIGGMGCIDDAGQHEKWAEAFLAEPMTYELAGDQLTLSTATASIVLTKH
jgi:heat shock protein HslJ